MLWQQIVPLICISFFCVLGLVIPLASYSLADYLCRKYTEAGHASSTLAGLTPRMYQPQGCWTQIRNPEGGKSDYRAGGTIAGRSIDGASRPSGAAVVAMISNRDSQ
ncbi:uncharacterized protein LY89DRAFT_107224 [Mollisia scopiformis]|uniref:Uncharacterized protein n=1 Tax=Mollisia scopiformis TaxID=149040 RepID=A0A194X599_MOLSC|nr:uncharacterized protein LY89DRAFT_107224 [Mollisia scopiformis]KUJ15244.1 hypothetical protein LY89DRAFT_107224 [Mollisia scopiformis]